MSTLLVWKHKIVVFLSEGAICHVMVGFNGKVDR